MSTYTPSAEQIAAAQRRLDDAVSRGHGVPTTPDTYTISFVRAALESVDEYNAESSVRLAMAALVALERHNR